MISMKDGEIHIKGRMPDILFELTALLREIKELLEKAGGPEQAKEAIMLAGKFAFMEDGDIDNLMGIEDREELLRRLGI